jgi:hypothetical protein
MYVYIYAYSNTLGSSRFNMASLTGKIIALFCAELCITIFCIYFGRCLSKLHTANNVILLETTGSRRSNKNDVFVLMFACSCRRHPQHNEILIKQQPWIGADWRQQAIIALYMRHAYTADRRVATLSLTCSCSCTESSTFYNVKLCNVTMSFKYTLDQTL